VTLIIAGVVLLAAYISNRYVMGQPPITTRTVQWLPMMRRMNSFIGIGGVVVIVVGLFFPQI
jgi:hypothetical protein